VVPVATPEVEAPTSVGRRRPNMVGVRLLPEEHAQLVRRAESQGVSVAEVLRRALLRDLQSV
jgi:hypothetical protein